MKKKREGECSVRIGIWYSCTFPNIRYAGRLLCRAYIAIKCYHSLPVSTEPALSCTQRMMYVTYLYLVWPYRLQLSQDDPDTVFVFVVLST
jgi:hypothetical protein